MAADDAPSDLLKLLEPNEKLVMYVKQKKHAAINVDSIAITDRQIIFRKPSKLRLKKSFTDYRYADIQNVKINKGRWRSKLSLNLKLDGSAFSIDNVANEKAEEALKLIRRGMDSTYS
jgi:oligoribonuclease (3'-5' exoribonuclease)